jgi:hypothetical protein
VQLAGLLHRLFEVIPAFEGQSQMLFCWRCNSLSLSERCDSSPSCRALQPRPSLAWRSDASNAALDSLVCRPPSTVKGP